jgi:hypothetical protein
MKNWLKVGSLALLLFAHTSAISADSNDALAPKSSAADALVSPLRRIVISSNSLPESLLFYRDAMGMTLAGPLDLASKERRARQQAWDISKNLRWQTYRLYRANVPNAAEIELVVFEQTQPAIHASWSALELGPFSAGFPNMDQKKQDQRVRELGFGALNALESYAVPRPDGSSYSIDETIFNAPDFVHGVGIHRGNGMAQLGDVDSNGLGGPAYSAQIVADAQAMIDFMTQVLGWELRSDRRWKSAGRQGALNVPDGTEFRFAIMYSKGAVSGHVLLLQYLNREATPSAAAAKVPHRGIGMWVMTTDDLPQVRANAKKYGAPLREIKSSPRPSVVVSAPNGFPIWIEQR